MRGRYPQTIISDLDTGLRDAILSELPTTKHVIPIWNIFSKVPSWYSLSLGSRYMEFKSALDALYRLESTEEFELQWNQMVSVFGLSTDKHISLLYSFRTSWALPYIRGHFIARMATAPYSKSVEVFLKGVCSSQSYLRSFFEQVLV